MSKEEEPREAVDEEEADAIEDVIDCLFDVDVDDDWLLS